jgi:ATP-dependent helicase YprA (DUF1998 family)
MNPIDVTNAIREHYISYLKYTFGFDDSMILGNETPENSLQKQFKKLIDDNKQSNRIGQGPFLEATAPYLTSNKTVQQFYDEGIFCNEFAELLKEPKRQISNANQSGGWRSQSRQNNEPSRQVIPADRKLYFHQYLAIERLCKAKPDELPHTVVSSGTGSGKTECFLYPIFDWILRHPNEGYKGIRAVLVYPMNALVNDQIRRLAELIGYWKDDKPINITFACYTGETPYGNKTNIEKGESDERKNNLAPLNQLLTRHKICANPPDILVTNFAMLEYALIRPQEKTFLSVADEFSWRFLILDEAHSYRGVQAMELSRLMQRVRAAVRRSKEERGIVPQDPVCIATSATLIDQRKTEIEKRAATIEFAHDLFGYERNTAAFTDESIIFAERTNPKEEPPFEFQNENDHLISLKAWANLNSEIFRNLDDNRDFNNFTETFKKIVSGRSDIWTKAKNTTQEFGNSNKRAFLYLLLKSHPHVHKLWEMIIDAEGNNPIPKKFEDLANNIRSMFSEGEIFENDSIKILENIVSACNSAKLRDGDQPLLPCRYHLFFSALEGVFVSLVSDKEMKEASEKEKQTWASIPLGIKDFQIGTDATPDKKILYTLGKCRNCNAPILNTPTIIEGQEQLNPQNKEKFFSLYPFKNLQATKQIQIDNSDSPQSRTLYIINSDDDGTDIVECPYCQRKQDGTNIFEKLETGINAPISVLAHSLYSQLKGNDKITQPQDYNADPIISNARKLLIFSDSRQRAAFLPSYIQDNFTEKLIRQLIINVLKNENKPLTLEGITTLVKNKIQEHKLHIPFFKDDKNFEEVVQDGLFLKSFVHDESTKKEKIKAAVLASFADKTAGAIDSLGLAIYKIDPNKKAGNDFFNYLDALKDNDVLDDFNKSRLTKQEFVDLFDCILDTMRHDVCIKGVTGYNNRETRLCCGTVANKDDSGKNFINFGGERTKYALFFAKWLSKRNGKIILSASQEVQDLTYELFDLMKKLAKANYIFEDDGNHTLQLLPDWFVCELLKPETSPLYYCSDCGHFQTYFLNGCCSKGKCNGKIKRVAEDEYPSNPKNWQNSYYGKQYFSDEFIEMRAEEHTAQLSSTMGQTVQKAFQDGQVNVLSCSTTFEMGVDIGSLEAILLHNVPPTTVNYLQRAGRAGRRADAVAIVLTFCQRNPHDQYHFRNPENIIAGKITPPRIDIDNVKVLKRHINVEILAEYLKYLVEKQNRVEFINAGNVGDFFFESITTVHSEIKNWFNNNRQLIENRLLSDFGKSVEENLNTYENNFFDELNRVYKILETFNCEYEENITRLNLEIQKLQDEKNKARIEKRVKDEQEKQKEINQQNDERRAFEQLKKQLMEKRLIACLCAEGVLPGFNFPIDVVELHDLYSKYNSKGSNKKWELSLTRDLKIAISEYAPGAEIDVAKLRFKSVGLQKFPKQQFDYNRWFWICPQCNNFVHFDAINKQDARNKMEEKTIPVGKDLLCPCCNRQLCIGDAQRWIEPKWGFVTNRRDKPKRTSKEPAERHYSTNVYFVDEGEPTVTPIPFFNGNVKIRTLTEDHGKLMVLNLGKYDQRAVKRGFIICPTCGRSCETRTGKHTNPYSKHEKTCKLSDADERIDHAAIGHQYDTDICWIEFSNTGRQIYEIDFWLSLGYAIKNATAEVMNIEPRDLGVTIKPINVNDKNYQAILLYDNVPGGAGYSKFIKDDFEEIIKVAREMLENCKCPLDGPACYNCLCEYSNSRHQHLLKRGHVIEYLKNL